MNNLIVLELRKFISTKILQELRKLIVRSIQNQSKQVKNMFEACKDMGMSF